MSATVELSIDDYDLQEYCGLLTQARSNQGLRYVVTPNVDHVIRYHDDPDFRRCYEAATHVLLDSRFLSRLLVLYRKLPRPPKVCTGSDLTAAVLSRVARADDRIILVGGTSAQADTLRARFGLRDLRHIAPPMGFIRDRQATEECMRDIEAMSPFRFCFLAVGSPHQEELAYRVKTRGRACGIVLCVGASINFLTDTERRAPRWMQRLGMEWLFRLAQNPKRLARRYLVRGPRIFWLLLQMQIRPRLASASPGW